MSDDENATTRFEMRASPTWLRRVDDWRRKQDDLPPRAEAIRRLVDAGFSAESASDSLRRALDEPDPGQQLTYIFSVVAALMPSYEDDEAIRRLVGKSSESE
jgi:hypothetical protein